MSNLIVLAEEAVKEWRASDGGLTMAACDVLHVARWAQGLVDKVAAGEVDRQSAIEELDEAVRAASTGSEGDVLWAALAAI